MSIKVTQYHSNKDCQNGKNINRSKGEFELEFCEVAGEKKCEGNSNERKDTRKNCKDKKGVMDGDIESEVEGYGESEEEEK